MLKIIGLFVFFAMPCAQAETLSSKEPVEKEKSYIEEEADLKNLQISDNADSSLVEGKEVDLDLSENLRDVEAFWNAEFESKMFADKSSTNTILSTEISGELKWRFLETLFIRAKGLVVGKNGFTQFIYDRTDRPSGFHLLSAFFEWKAFPNISVLIGNIQQDFLSAPLLVTDKTFPSAIGEWAVDYFPDYDLKFLFQFAIPDNASEELRRETQIIKVFPVFLTSSFALDTQNDFLDISISERFTLFQYYNLSPAVADRSRVYGNSVLRVDSDSVFKYAFFGLHNNLSFQKVLSDLWALSWGAEFIYNLMAPDTHNEGIRLYTSVYHNYKETMEIKLTGELFASQSDVSVAYYNSETYGHNNRKGFLARFENHFFRSGLTLETVFVYGKPINEAEKSPTGEAFSFAIAVKTNNIAI
ncbi:MAG: hypothetical protein OXJ52_08180 [Oligoflexia bacterium]|nr:hypothetical protein [Oligoflexia bacterium]